MSGDHNMYAGGGGPAFPAMHFDLTDNEHGMTLRDYFAAKAMQGLYAADAKHEHDDADIFRAVAQAAYMAADAMLEARKETP